MVPPPGRSLLDELKQRRVLRVAGVYIVAGFAFIQAAELIFPRVGMPEWTISAAVVITLLGFPIACALAWAFDIGPAGIVRAEGWQTVAGATPRRAALAWAGTGAIGAIVLLGAYATISGPNRGAADAEDLRSIAVLPFVDMSSARNQEYFADGITEEILNALAQIEGLHVAARTSSFAFKGRNLPVDSIALQLGVRTVLEGSLRREGDRLRITAQLIDAHTGYHLWSENYDREVADVFAVQDEISRAIAEEMRVELGIAADEVLVDAATASTEAHDLYLRGLFDLNRRGDSERNLHDAVELFGRAVGLDPEYADAWIGLGMAYELLPIYSPGADTAQSVRLARESIERALAIDPAIGRAHTVLGDLVFHYEWDLAGAEREHRTALRLSPNDATAWAWLAEPLAAQGRTGEAIEAARRAVRLDPLDAKVNADLGWMLYLDRQFEASLEQLMRTLELHPQHVVTIESLAYTYVATGRMREARDMFARAAQTGSRMLTGHADVAVRVLDGVLEPGRRADGLAAAGDADNSPLSRAMYLLVLGERDAALQSLEEAVDRHELTMPLILVEPVFDPIREDPRFQALIEITRRPVAR